MHFLNFEITHPVREKINTNFKMIMIIIQCNNKNTSCIWGEKDVIVIFTALKHLNQQWHDLFLPLLTNNICKGRVYNLFYASIIISVIGQLPHITCDTPESLCRTLYKSKVW